MKVDNFREFNYKRYLKHYSRPEVKKVYIEERIPLYQFITKELLKLRVKSALDIGCSYGLLVDILNHYGINAYGLDFPIEELQKYHRTLSCSDKFFYGDFDQPETVHKLNTINWDAIVCLDTFRYITNVNNFCSLRAKYMVFKELSLNRWTKNQLLSSAALYPPVKLCQLFSDYKPVKLYPSKHIFLIRNPSSAVMKLVNALFPTYFLILERR